MQEILIAFVITLCMSLGLMLRYAPFASVTTPKQKRIAHICYGLLTLFNFVVMAAALLIQGITVAFIYLRFGGIVYGIIVVLINIAVIPDKIREHLFVFGVVTLCHYLLMSIPNYVITFIPEGSYIDLLAVILSIYSVALLLTYWPLRTLLCDTVGPFLDLDSSEYWNTVWFIPIAFFGTKFLSLGGEHDSGSIQQLLSSMLYIAVIILMCMTITTSHQRIRERRIMEKQLEDQKIHYAELKVKIDEARKTNHDFKHHVTVMHHYIDIGDQDGLRRYCDGLMEHINGQGSVPYTGNVAADGVLYHYMQQSAQKNIAFRYYGAIQSHGIADVDLCALLGNALDNALTACLTIPQDRSITVISQVAKNMLSIAISNTFDGKIQQNEGSFLSRKRENSPGIGISSMQSICQHYNGSVDTMWDEHNFTVMFILPLTNP